MTDSLKDQIRRAKELGILVEGVRRTGEIKFVAPGEPTVRVSHPSRRKDGARAVEQLIRRYEQSDRRDQR